MDQMRFVAHVDVNRLQPELATFHMGDAAKGEATWSADREALYIPVLRLAPHIIRGVVHGGTIFKALNAVYLVQVRSDEARYNRSRWSYVWGDLQVFETGSPIVSGAIFLRGAIETPDLTTVGRYLKQMPKSS